MGRRDGRRSAPLSRAVALRPCRAMAWRTAPALARHVAHEIGRNSDPPVRRGKSILSEECFRGPSKGRSGCESVADLHHWAGWPGRARLDSPSAPMKDGCALVDWNDPVGSLRRPFGRNVNCDREARKETAAVPRRGGAARDSARALRCSARYRPEWSLHAGRRRRPRARACAHRR